ncbi:MAG: hypothetical protein ACRDPO_37950, partial [Streptosporangiaceae bacterium]
MAGALGEGGCTAPASAYSDYENSVGTGQMHLWFARPGRGWTGLDGLTLGRPAELRAAGSGTAARPE